MKTFLLLTTIFISYSLPCQNSLAICNYKQIEFDNDTCCWRALSRKDSFTQAANMIVAYLQCGNQTLNNHSLQWHAGQTFACAGLNTMAKKYFRKTYNMFTKWFGGKDGRAWYYYAKGSVAFLDRNKVRLHRIIAKWENTLEKDLNYESLVLLYANFSSSYRMALLH